VAAGPGGQAGLLGLAAEDGDVVAGDDVVDGVVLLHRPPRLPVPVSRSSRYG
jgi:hypothetical protein